MHRPRAIPNQRVGALNRGGDRWQVHEREKARPVNQSYLSRDIGDTEV